MPWKCFGCGEQHETHSEIPFEKYFSIDKSVSLCSVRDQGYHPKKRCIELALRILHEDRVCPVCGDSGNVYGHSAICHSCKQCYEFGRAHYNKVGELEEKIAREIIEKLRRWPYTDDHKIGGVQKWTIGKAFDEVLQAKYLEGAEAGSKLLRGLATGAVGARDFEDVLRDGAEARSGAVDRIRKLLEGV